MPKSTDSLLSAVQEIESQGLAIPQSESKFVTCILRTMPDTPSKREKAVILASGLERLLSRHHSDSKLIVSASVALAENSEYEIPDFVKKLGRFMKFLDAPVASHSIKNIKLASFVGAHPDIIRIKHIDSLTALGRLPEGAIEQGDSKNEFRIGDARIDIQTADVKDINKAVKKAKADAAPPKKAPKEKSLEREPESMDEAAFLEGEAEPGEGRAFAHHSESLPLELSEAARVLAKVLGRLSSDDAHSELSHALEEARKLLLMAVGGEALGARAEAEKITEELHWSPALSRVGVFPAEY